MSAPQMQADDNTDKVINSFSILLRQNVKKKFKIHDFQRIVVQKSI